MKRLAINQCGDPKEPATSIGTFPIPASEGQDEANFFLFVRLCVYIVQITVR